MHIKVIQLATIASGILVYGYQTDWNVLRQKLEGYGLQVATKEDWVGRGDFFVGEFPENAKEEGESCWVWVSKFFSGEPVGAIKVKELEHNELACQALVKHLPNLSNTEILPTIFRHKVYEFLRVEGDFRKNAGIIESIPAAWLKNDSVEIIKVLGLSSPPRLHLLQNNVLESLLESPEACEHLTLEMLESLKSELWTCITSKCVAAIGQLEHMDLSKVIENFPSEAFSLYNGPLSKETIKRMSGPQIKSYGSSISSKQVVPICKSLQLQHLRPFLFSWLTANCLFGYLNEQPSRRLGEGWKNIPISIMKSFTKEMKSSWLNIHSDDFAFMEFELRRDILSFPKVCQGFNLPELTKDVIEHISGSCLQELLIKSKGLVGLGKLWDHIPRSAIEEFTEEMMVAVIGNVAFSDFPHLDSKILKIVFNSDLAISNLPRPTENIIISPNLEWFYLPPKRFESIARVAPNLAGQLLLNNWYSQTDILTSCDGNTLRTLTYYWSSNNNSSTADKGEKLYWSSLFSRLEGKSESFREMIRAVSRDAGHHLCSTIRSIEEYLTLDWLRHVMDEGCRSKLSFDLLDPIVPLEAPELIKEAAVPWQRMLEKYLPQDWFTVSTNERLANILGGEKEFWITINNDERRHDTVLAMSRKALKFIQPSCVAELGYVLGLNPWLVSFLAPNAFAEYRFDLLPCSIKLLSPEQISELSCNFSRRDKVQMSQPVHKGALTRFTRQLESLDSKQFEAFYKSKCILVPKDVEYAALECHFNILSNQIRKVIMRKEGESFAFERLESKVQIQVLQSLNSLLKIYERLGFTDERADFERKLGELVPIIPKSESYDSFVGIFRQSPILRPMLVGLARNPDELREYLLEAVIDTSPTTKKGIKIPFDRTTGFDRKSIITLLEAHPQVFADPKVLVFEEGITDRGGPTLLLVSQILADMQRDLIVPGSKPGYQKFTWGISGRMGSIVGVVLGRAFQLDLRLPFSLDPEFYSLLGNFSENSIENYYYSMYDKDISEFKGKVQLLYDGLSEEPPNLEILDILTRPESIRFTKLSLATDVDGARGDFTSKTNIYGCNQGEDYKDLQEISIQDGFAQAYLSKVLPKVLEEFKSFIQGLVKGLGHALPPIRNFSTTSPVVLNPLVQFLPAILNAKPINAKDLLERIEVKFDGKVDSFLEGSKVLASEILVAFIKSLEERQLAHFIGVWTGSSTISLERTKLKVILTTPSLKNYVKLNFCDPIDSNTTFMKDYILAPGEQYQNFFKKFITTLFRSSVNLKPDCTKKGSKFIPPVPITCSKSLILYLQPAQQMLNSLVDLLDTPLSVIRDH